MWFFFLLKTIVGESSSICRSALCHAPSTIMAVGNAGVSQIRRASAIFA